MEFSLDPQWVVDLATEWGLKVLGAIAIFVVGWFVSRWAHRRTILTVDARGLDKALGRFIASLIQWTVLVAAVIAAIDTVGFQVTSLVAVFASAGLAVGLALQGNLSHFASGVMVLIFRPFTIDDVVTIGGNTGKVVEVGLFATKLHTPDGKEIIVPNGAVTGGIIVNITTRGVRRCDVEVGVAYGEDPARVVALLKEVTQGCELIIDEPASDVVFTGLGASSINFLVTGWANSADWWVGCHQIRTACYNALNEAGIEIPFDQVVVHRAEAAEAAAAK